MIPIHFLIESKSDSCSAEAGKKRVSRVEIEWKVSHHMAQDELHDEIQE